MVNTPVFPSTVPVKANLFESCDQNRPVSVDLGTATRRIRSWTRSKSITTCGGFFAAVPDDEPAAPLTFSGSDPCAGTPSFGPFLSRAFLIFATALASVRSRLDFSSSSSRSQTKKMSTSVSNRRPVKAISLPSGDQSGSDSLSGWRERLNGGREPSTGTIQMSSLKSSSERA
jgi:hypothetical protein